MTRSSQAPATSWALVIVSAMLFLSGVSRLGIGAVAVLAAETEPAPPQASGTEPDRLLQALRAREAEVRAQEARLAEREAELARTQAEIRAQLDALAAAEAQLRQTLSQTETAAEGDVSRLVAAYENMKPKQAADLFAQMDVTFAAGFFIRLRPEFAGAVLAEMDPVAAYALSAVLAGRHARTPKE